jgi:hypothetical protein
MQAAQIVLEYLKVALSAPVMSAAIAFGLALLYKKPAIALINRIAMLKVAGIGELQTSQAARAEPSTHEGSEAPQPLPAESVSAAGNLSDPTATALVKAERERAYLWEYRYLNLFLVRGTQIVLEWFAARESPTAFQVYDGWWSSLVLDPNERFARVAILKSHYLLVEHNGLLSVSEKGREYLAWRGPLPQLPAGA